MSLNTKMTALANEIRELSGTTTSKSIDSMTTDIDTANNEINSQTDLIAQITTALEGKAGGAGGVTLPPLDTPASASDILEGKEAINENGEVVTGTIQTKTSNDLTVNGATVTVPAGYYDSQQTKSVETATQATPSVSIDANGKITASATQSAGYVSAGTKSGTKQLTTQAAKTITPSTSSQTAVAKNVYTTGEITVGAIPSNYEDVGTETTEYTSLNAELEAVINSLPEAGSGGSGEIETCTLQINVAEDRRTTPFFCFVNVLEGNTISTIQVDSTTTITNVIKGSEVIIIIPEAGGHWYVDFLSNYQSSLIQDAFSSDGMAIMVNMYQITKNGTLEIY